MMRRLLHLRAIQMKDQVMTTALHVLVVQKAAFPFQKDQRNVKKHKSILQELTDVMMLIILIPLIVEYATIVIGKTTALSVIKVILKKTTEDIQSFLY